MKSVSYSDLDLLRATMDEATIGEDDKDVLIGGMEVIEDHFKT